MAMISTHYYPPNDLPLISLTVKDGKLLLLDWYNDKTVQLFDKLGKQAVFVAPDKLDKANDDQAVALEVIRQLDE